MTYEILRIENVYKQYGIKVVLEGIDLSLNRGERAALVGENGVGKTTLARIITGYETSDGGSIRLIDNAQIGYLSQEMTTQGEVTIGEYVAEAVGALHRMQAELRDLEAQMAQTLPPLEMDKVLARYADLEEQFRYMGGYELEYRMEQIFDGLGIAYLQQNRIVKTLSGGEKTRIALAGLLLREPDILILDEPTNHLDFAGIEWLENYLSNYPNALLLITHDRQFINRIVNQIIEISPVTHNLSVYHGDYDDYLAQREHEIETAVAEYMTFQSEKKRLQRLMKTKAHNTGKGNPPRDGDKFLKNFKQEVNENRVGREIRDARQQLTVLEANPLDNPRHLWNVRFMFDPEPLVSAEPVHFEGISKTFDGKVVLNNISATATNGERIVIVAPNGTGKTTLLRILMGLEVADTGTVTISPSAKVGYLDQDGETMDFDRTVLEVYRDYATGTLKEMQAQLHRSGLWTDGDLLSRNVGDLSVGQRRKLGLARIIASRANVLLLDEPTNHLDFLSLEALEAGLHDFAGTLIAVSHDRWFIDRIATQVWRLHDGKLTVERS